MQPGKLFLVGLPVGNWEDMSVRAYRYIKNAKNIVIEREEAFENIWPALGMEKPNVNIVSIEMDSNGGEPGVAYELKNMPVIIELLKSGEDVYLISDDGMPGVADPGALIVSEAIKEGIEITSTPGPSVAIAAVAVTGTMHNFSFESFLPFTKTDRIKFLTERKHMLSPMVLVLRNVKRNEIDGLPPVFHEEIPDFLSEAVEIFGEHRHAALCYNLTMPTEKIVRGTLRYLKEYFDITERNTQDLISIVIDKPHGNMAI